MNLQNLSDAQARELGAALDRAQMLLRIATTPRTCRTCLMGGVSGGVLHCSKWDATPPPEVIERGCDEWQYDDVPF